ncbi:MAG TPA: hypothetical protein VFD82_02820 [Planctomycetota bacterium]|nr:hypothetical protein [Planctomycetota bacterium]
MGPLQDDQYEGEHFDGHGFPSEAEWLQLGGPGPGSTAELEVSNDFVDRTLRALRSRAAGDHAGESPGDASAEAGTGLPAKLLRAYAAPEPTINFVTRTLTALRADRLAHWRELLARYVAPEPSPEFVARTLSALTAGRRPGEAGRGRYSNAGGSVRAWLPRAWPLLAIAAATLLWLLPWNPPMAPLELRVSRQEPAAFARSYAATPLPAVLATLNQAADPGALNDGGADGVWLLLGSKQ